MPRRRSVLLPQAHASERVPSINRQALSLRASRAPALLLFLGGLYITIHNAYYLFSEIMLVTRPTIHPKSECRAALVRELRVAASAAGHGPGRVGLRGTRLSETFSPVIEMSC